MGNQCYSTLLLEIAWEYVLTIYKSLYAPMFSLWLASELFHLLPLAFGATFIPFGHTSLTLIFCEKIAITRPSLLGSQSDSCP